MTDWNPALDILQPVGIAAGFCLLLLAALGWHLRRDERRKRKPRD